MHGHARFIIPIAVLSASLNACSTASLIEEADAGDTGAADRSDAAPAGGPVGSDARPTGPDAQAPVAPDASRLDDAGPPPTLGDATSSASPDAGGRPPAPDAAVPPPPDPSHGAAFDGQDVPARIGTGRAFAVRVAMRNTGTATWSREAGYHLGTADPMDDPTWGATRAFMDESVQTPPGEAWNFVTVVHAPAAAGLYGMRWQMLQEGVEWFGEASPATTVEVVDEGPPVQGPFDLAQVEIQSSPDVRGWPVTSQITSISFRPGNFHIDHALRGQWPPVVIDPNDGTEQEATVWVFFYIGDRWYGTGGERLRPNQADKQLGQPSEIGPGWLYDANRWGPMTNYVPQPGELVGFMIAAGSTRSDANFIVQERTAVVLIPFPRDGEETSFPPFAGGE